MIVPGIVRPRLAARYPLPAAARLIGDAPTPDPDTPHLTALTPSAWVALRQGAKPLGGKALVWGDATATGVTLQPPAGTPPSTFGTVSDLADDPALFAWQFGEDLRIGGRVEVDLAAQTWAITHATAGAQVALMATSTERGIWLRWRRAGELALGYGDELAATATIDAAAAVSVDLRWFWAAWDGTIRVRAAVWPAGDERPEGWTIRADIPQAATDNLDGGVVAIGNAGDEASINIDSDAGAYKWLRYAASELTVSVLSHVANAPLTIAGDQLTLDGEPLTVEADS